MYKCFKFFFINSKSDSFDSESLSTIGIEFVNIL